MSEGDKTEGRGHSLLRRASTANIRANVIRPGLLDAAMVVDMRARGERQERAEVAAKRDTRVPLRLQLRVKDIDFTSNQIVVRGGKGDKDRHTMLPGR